MLSSAKYYSYILNYLITLFLVFSTYKVVACPPNLQDSDSVNAKLRFSYKSNQDTINFQKTSASFYKTDSIFSFQSRKGYLPSLFNNFEEQVLSLIHI